MAGLLRRAILLATLAASGLAPLHAQWYKSYQDGLDAVHNQQWQEAIARFNDAISDKAESKARARTYGVMNFIDYFPYVYRGLAEYRLGNESQALADFEKEDALGEVHHASDDKDAEKILNENLAILKKGAVADTKFEEGRKLYKAGEFQKAIDAFRAVPKNSASWSAAAKYVEMAQAELSKATPRQTAAARKTLVDTDYKDGVRLFNRKDLAAAKDKFNAVVAADPGHAGANRYLSRIRTLQARQSPGRAEPTADAGSRAEENADQAAYQEAVRLFNAGLPEKARGRFQALRDANPGLAEAKAYLDSIDRVEEKVHQGIALLFDGQYQQAIDQLAEVARKNNEDGRMFAALACAYATKYLLAGGDDSSLYRDALEAYRKAKQLDGTVQLDGKYVSPRIIALLNQ